MRSTDIETVGGKAASLGELTAAGPPVPPGFVVTADNYQMFLKTTKIGKELFADLDINHDYANGLAAAASQSQKLLYCRLFAKLGQI